MNQDEGLKRSIGVWGLAANNINIIVGAGIFALPAIVAGKLGAASIFAYLFCGFLISLVILCFAEAGSKVTNSGGPYTYIETAFGNYAGFISGIFAIVANLMASAAVINLLADILGTFYPIFLESWVRILFITMVYLALATINIIGVKQGMGLVKLSTVLKLTPLILLAIIGWKNVSMTNLDIQSFPEISVLGESSLILFFAFLGCETGLIVGGEVKNVNRTLPKAVLIATGTVIVLYVLLQLVSQGVLGDALPNYKATPLAETAKVVFGPLGLVMITIGSIISIFGLVSGDMLNTPRVLYALARDRVIPIKKLSKIHPRFATPTFAIIVYASLAFLAALTGSFEHLAAIATSTVLLLYLGVAFSVIKLRRMQSSKQGEFKIPGGLIVPVLAIITILYFLSHLSIDELLATLGFIVLLTIIFVLIEYFYKNRIEE